MPALVSDSPQELSSRRERKCPNMPELGEHEALSSMRRPLLLFTGKGGVGKSSVVAGLALAAAKEGRRPLIVELGHRASMEAIFNVEQIGPEPVAVRPGVFAVNLDLESSLKHYFRQNVPIKRAAEALANNSMLQKFFKAAPAVPEIATLNRLRSLLEERQGERRRWDPVIVDLDATGHALMLFNLPKVMNDLVGRGPLRSLIDGFVKIFRDPETTSLNLVTLPRELPIQETTELYDTLEKDHQIPMGMVVVNQMPKQPLSPGQRKLLQATQHHGGAPVSATLRAELARTQSRCEQYDRATELVEHLSQKVELPVRRLPAVSTDEIRDLDRLSDLASTLLWKAKVSA